MQWVMANFDREAAASLAATLGISPTLARLLSARGVTDAESAWRYLNPLVEHLHNPRLMLDVDAAECRLRRAIANQESVLIYGDYDVDGVMAAVTLRAALRSLGAKVECYIPNRLTDGYGMNVAAVDQAAAAGARVIVSADTGIRDYEALARAAELAIDAIVTDHHLPGDRLPSACAILNPRRAGCTYPEKNLAGVGVALKLAQVLLGAKLTGAALRSYLKVAAIGSIADAVPLTGENRVIARAGLDGLTQTARAGVAEGPANGIVALLSVSGLCGRCVSAADVAFRIAPRINAAGRMAHATEVMKLFDRPSRAEAQSIAADLDDLNGRRQRVEDEIVRHVEQRVKAVPGMAERYTFVFAGEGWHRGVIGIAAQRLVDHFHRPALVISIDGSTAHGSGRSISGFHLLNALTASASLFNRFGGHAQAAGFSLPASRIPQLEEQFEAYARSTLTPEHLAPVLRIDAPLDLSELTPELYAEVQQMEPFGRGNPAPVFRAGATLASVPRILKEKHLKLSVSAGGRRFDAVGWGLASVAADLAGVRRAELAFNLSEHTFQGLTSLQLVLRDVKPA